MELEVTTMERFTLTVRNVTQDEDYLYVTFDKPANLQYENGQYGIFLHVEKDVEGRKMRAFSFASANDEDELVIGTRAVARASSFKEWMKRLTPGDHMTVDGPTGRFTFQPNKPGVFLAGGIGITPIRAMLRGLDDATGHTLIFSEAMEEYPFLQDIERIPGLTLELTSGVPRTRFLIEQATRLHHNDAVYYISGSPSFVNGITEQLDQLGITTNNIRFDRFTGY
jgi:ferredoxin-NADP reductase